MNPETINPLTLPSLALADRKRLPNCAAVYFVLEGETVIYLQSRECPCHNQRFGIGMNREQGIATTTESWYV